MAAPRAWTHVRATVFWRSGSVFVLFHDLLPGSGVWREVVQKVSMHKSLSIVNQSTVNHTFILNGQAVEEKGQLPTLNDDCHIMSAATATAKT